jgi:hypothetical protein
VTPLVTVVVPTRNRLPLLREAVASVRAQDMPAWELLVVDDASSDGSAAWVESLADSRVRAIRLDTHLERSAARNRGLAEATAPMVLFLDDDDRLRPTALRLLSTALERASGAAAALGAKEVFDDAGHHKRIPHQRVRLVRPVWEDVMAGWMFVSGQVLLRTDAVRAAGGWDEDLTVAEDQDLWLRVPGRRPAVLVPTIVLEQRTRPEGAVGADEIESALRIAVVGELQGRDRRRAEQLVAARRQLRAAGRAFEEEHFAEAAGALVRAARAAPSLLASPIWGPQLLLSTAKGAAAAALPGPAGRWARRTVKDVRTRLGRNPVEPGVRPIGREKS